MTTWLLVTTRPSSSMIKPLPEPAPSSSLRPDRPEDANGFDAHHGLDILKVIDGAGVSLLPARCSNGEGGGGRCRQRQQQRDTKCAGTNRTLDLAKPTVRMLTPYQIPGARGAVGYFARKYSYLSESAASWQSVILPAGLQSCCAF